ncbi:MAG TPA: polysaccharide biosynthesis tyrosine autokinase [Gaiellaceae bacterium]|nr:polysaccharide biosynthesis tyrosine autokinase [Gaiellaceae bacterium]
MSADQLLVTLWRRKWIVLLTVLVATVATYAVSLQLPKVYSAEATLFVGNRSEAGSDFEAIQSSQVLARTYAELIQSPNVAARVAEELPGGESPSEVLERTSFRPISDTQLLVVQAEGSTPTEAAELANAYAQGFASYVETELPAETNGEVTVADAAQPPASAVRPRPALYTAVMFVFALFLGAGLALLRDRLDTRLGSEEELANELGVPVLARVPTLGRRRRQAKAREQRFLEAFRILRTNLAFLSPQQPLASVVLASASPAEGKSTCAIALARVMAEQGRRVLVIEGDLRRPALARMYELDGPAIKGLTHYLALGWRFEEVVHETPVRNVFVMPAGAVPPNPSTLLRPDALKSLLADAAEWADFVIVDSPPLSAGADATILAHAVGTVIFVVNHRRGSRTKVAASIRQLRQTDATIAGLIVNEIAGADDSDRYYGEVDPTEAHSGPLTATRPPA